MIFLIASENSDFHSWKNGKDVMGRVTRRKMYKAMFDEMFDCTWLKLNLGKSLKLRRNF